jgi:O-antigen ligase
MRPRHTPVPLLIKVLIVSVFLPEGLSFYIAGLRLTVARLTLLVITPILAVQLARSMGAAKYRFVLSDLLVLLTGLWMFLAVSVNQDLVSSLNHAGPEVMEICIGYLATRVLLTEHGQALSFANLLCWTIGIVALLGLLDPLTDHVYLHEWANKLTGYQEIQVMEGQLLYRHGRLRAYGPLEQPLLYGLTCCVGLILALGSRVRVRFFLIIACSLGVFFSGESAPLLGVVLGVGLLLYDRILSRISRKWALLIAAAAVGIFLTSIFSDDPSTVIVRHLTLDPQTGYYRLWTWDLAMDLLRQSPWVGLGFFGLSGDYELPSIDNMWLAFALTYGYPGSVLFGLSMLGAMLRPSSGPPVSLTAAESRLATTLSIILVLIALVAYTVHIWGADRILMGLLIGARAHLGALGRLPARVQPRRLAFDLAPVSEPTGSVL